MPSGERAPSTSRRRLLRLTAASAATGLAGCAGTSDGDGDGAGGVTIIERVRTDGSPTGRSSATPSETGERPTTDRGSESTEATDRTADTDTETESTDTATEDERPDTETEPSTTRELRIVAADGAAAFEYTFTVDGEAELVTTGEYNAVPKDDTSSGKGEEVVENADGTTTISGIVADGGGDTFRFTGELIDSEIPGRAAVYIDGALVEDTASGSGISSCLTIDEPGEYVLAGDLSGSTSVCIDIRSDDVLLDGDGHTLSGTDRRGTGIAAAGSDVTVRNVTVRGFEVGIEPDGATVEDCRVTANATGISAASPRSAGRVVGCEIEANDGYGIYLEGLEGEAFAVRESRVVANGDDGIASTAFDLAIRETDVLDNDGFGIRGSDASFSIEASTVGGNAGGIAVDGRGRIDGTVVDDNSGPGIEAFGAFGIRATSVGDNGGDGIAAGTPVPGGSAPTVSASAVTGNGGDGIVVDVDGDAGLGVTGSTIADNAGLGVRNAGSALVDARENYWGAPDGPSSPATADGPLRDPNADVFADGGGDAVSEGETAGVANVRFAPWLESEP